LLFGFYKAVAPMGHIAIVFYSHIELTLKIVFCRVIASSKILFF